MQPAGSWSGGWNRQKSHSDRRNGTFGFRCYTILYAIEAAEVSRIKFGITSNIGKRFRQLSGGCPVPLNLMGYVWMPIEAETLVFQFLDEDRVHGEWFRRTERSRSIAALIAAKKDRDLAEIIELDYLIPQDRPSVDRFYTADANFNISKDYL